jgi:hypothetical protein
MSLTLPLLRALSIAFGFGVSKGGVVASVLMLDAALPPWRAGVVVMAGSLRQLTELDAALAVGFAKGESVSGSLFLKRTIGAALNSRFTGSGLVFE